MKFTIANALTIIDKYKVESAKKMGMTFNNLYNSCTNVEAIPKDQYKARLKADMVAMLTELQLEIEELDPSGDEWSDSLDACNDIIQQKIDKLKERRRMTNGEKIKEISPDIEIVAIVPDEIVVIKKLDSTSTYSNQSFSYKWWNAEYKEPITENCIVCKYDETEEEDGEHCKKCLAGGNQFELDKEFVEPTTKNCESCRYYGSHHEVCNYCYKCSLWTEKEPTTQERQAESDKFDAAFQDGYNHGYAQARFDYEQEPTTKNDLAVDCISRQAVLEQAYAYGNGLEPDGYCVNVEDIQALPSVTPQNQVYPLCEDCHTKMDEVRRAYDNAMKQEPILDKIKSEANAECISDGLGRYIRFDVLDRIINKYKGESEKNK